MRGDDEGRKLEMIVEVSSIRDNKGGSITLVTLHGL